jgi:hypothetical protein
MHRLWRLRTGMSRRAIKPDIEPGAEKWLKLNAEYAKLGRELRSKAPRLTLRIGGSRPNSNTSRRIPARVIEANRDVRFAPSGH